MLASSSLVLLPGGVLQMQRHTSLVLVGHGSTRGRRTLVPGVAAVHRRVLLPALRLAVHLQAVRLLPARQPLLPVVDCRRES